MTQRIDDPLLLRDLLGLDTLPLVRSENEPRDDDATAASWSAHRSGPPAGETVLLIAGLGMHRIEWSAELIRALHAAGYGTLTVDNHDAGHSELRPATASYSLPDLAEDLSALLRVLGLEAVHVVGISMGGMIAQHLAMRAPERTRSLTSLASTTGRRGVGRPVEEAKWIFRSEVPSDRAEYREYVRRHHRSITSPAARDEERAVWVGERVWERGIRPDGVRRQFAAIGEDGDRTERLGQIDRPTLVVHGDADPMIDVSGGIDTAASIPGSRLEVVPTMGHVVTWQVASLVAELLVGHFRGA